jgi:hypothetical protein
MTEQSLDGAPVDTGLPKKPVGHRLSEILLSIAQTEQERISIGDLLTVLDHRALAALLFIFAVPNAFPAPPGISTILAAPMIFLAAQLAIGLKPWLPRFIAERSLKREEFQALIKPVAPWLAKAERLMKPRLEAFTSLPVKRLVGAVCLLLSVILILPIFLGNMLPAIAVCVLALGLLERDGAFVLAGLGIAVVSVVVVAIVVGTAAWAAFAIASNIFR